MYIYTYVYIYNVCNVYVNIYTWHSGCFLPHLLLGIPGSAAASLRHGLVVEAAALIVLAMASPCRPENGGVH